MFKKLGDVLFFKLVRLVFLRSSCIDLSVTILAFYLLDDKVIVESLKKGIKF